MFSPSQLIQSLVQRAPVSAPKPVELTPGQVFKGTVVKLYPDQMALVQIGGMQVQAKLEANLEQGQKAWLQVQPSSGVVTLKVLDTPVDGTGKEASMESLIRSLGLPETKESKAVVTALMNANLPVQKETVAAFTAVAARIGTDDATVEAFMMAVKRGLPLTPDAVAGLKAFLAEKPISQVIQNFLQQASLFLDGQEDAAAKTGAKASEGQAGQANGAIRQLVGQLKEKVAALPVSIPTQGEEKTPQAVQQSMTNRLPSEAPDVALPSRMGEGSRTTAVPASLAQTNPPVPGIASDAAQSATRSPGTPSAPAANQPILQAAPESQQQPAAATGKGQLNNASVPGGTGSQSQPQVVPLPLASASPQTVSQPVGVLSDAQQPTIHPGQSRLAEIAGQAGTGTIQQSKGTVAPAMNGTPVSAMPTIPAVPGTHPIQELFRQMGIAHERELMGQAIAGAVADAGVHKQMESVKAMLLQITQAPSSAVPVALREAADQLLQQVTGQQLMMVQPTSQALSQIVMQIPIRSAQGEETAYVQIESKKKGGGQVDAENCRLFFHLELQTMGTTMIDVSIVNRIVNLQIFNDAPWVDKLVQGMKEGFAEQLQEVGYQLSAVRVQSVPEQRTKATLATGARGALLSDYKGVDLRV